jgi:Na+-translocating ferredoxin:NAD+ oxidoreductase RnfC subunit
MPIRKTFKGGHVFGKYRGRPEDSLVEAGLSPKLIIPLKQGFGTEVRPVVVEGEKVRAGQIIGRDDAVVSSPVHSSAAGTVTEIKKINYFRREISAMVIDTSAAADQSVLRLEGASGERWRDLPDEKIEELVYLSGASSLDREGIPTRYKSSIIPPAEVSDVIVHGVGSEVYNLSLNVLLGGKRIFHLAESLGMLQRIMPRARIHLALGESYRQLGEQIAKLLSDPSSVRSYVCPSKYPQGYDEVLVPTILGKKFPYGYSAATIGVVVLNIQAALAVYDAVADGMPTVSRIMALCGPGFKSNPHVKVRVGTPLDFIVKNFRQEGLNPRFILNSPLTGPSLSDLSLPVDKTFTHIIAIPEDSKRRFMSFMAAGADMDSFSSTFPSAVSGRPKRADTNLHGEERPCVFCNFCREACPVALEPHFLYHHVKKNMIDESLLRYGIFNCIDCNMCSYVCPSKIPLAAEIKDGKEKLINMGCDQSLCVLPYFDLKGLEEYRGIK